MKYETEETLIEKVQSGEYGWKDYICHHSRELEMEYQQYCHIKGIDPNEEESAVEFMDYREQLFEEAMKNENV